MHGETQERLLKNHEEGSGSYLALKKPLVYQPDFEFKGEKPEKVKMFFPNPEKNWGPKGKAHK